MNEFCNEINNNKKIENITSANEGSAVSLGVGYHLITKNSLYLFAEFRYGKCNRSFN